MSAETAAGVRRGAVLDTRGGSGQGGEGAWGEAKCNQSCHW